MASCPAGTVTSLHCPEYKRPSLKQAVQGGGAEALEVEQTNMRASQWWPAFEKPTLKLLISVFNRVAF